MLALVVIGSLPWLISTSHPERRTSKPVFNRLVAVAVVLWPILNWSLVIAAIVWLLCGFGIISSAIVAGAK